MINLEKFVRQDYDTLISWIDSKEMLMQFAGPGFTFPLTTEQLDMSLSDQKRFAFKVTETQSKSMVGYGEIYLKETTVFLGRIIIGEKKLRGQGIGLLIVNQLTAYALKNFPITNIELNVFDWNISAIKCYEKAGFVINPYRISERKVNGETWTVLRMVLEKKDRPENSEEL
jgi:RimJ/RimL family protein N-acetyltransferase